MGLWPVLRYIQLTLRSATVRVRNLVPLCRASAHTDHVCIYTHVHTHIYTCAHTHRGTTHPQIHTYARTGTQTHIVCTHAQRGTTDPQICTLHAHATPTGYTGRPLLCYAHATPTGYTGRPLLCCAKAGTSSDSSLFLCPASVRTYMIT